MGTSKLGIPLLQVSYRKALSTQKQRIFKINWRIRERGTKSFFARRNKRVNKKPEKPTWTNPNFWESFVNNTKNAVEKISTILWKITKNFAFKNTQQIIIQCLVHCDTSQALMTARNPTNTYNKYPPRKNNSFHKIREKTDSVQDRRNSNFSLHGRRWLRNCTYPVR